MSFFKSNKNFIIEIQSKSQNETSETNENIFPTYNLGEWKIFTSDDSIRLNVLQNKVTILNKIKNESKKPFGLIVTSISEIEIASLYAHFLYIPGEICRQSDILEHSAKTKLPLIIERGSFLAANDISRVIDKLGSAEIAIVDCGTANGYSDSILDPRVLFTLQNSGKPFGIHLSDLLAPEGTKYPHRPQWLMNYEFVSAFINTGNAFGASFYVIKNYGNGTLVSNNIIHKIPRNL